MTKSSDLSGIEAPKSESAFYEKATVGINLCENECMVITRRWDDWDIKRGLIDQGSYIDILY